MTNFRQEFFNNLQIECGSSEAFKAQIEASIKGQKAPKFKPVQMGKWQAAYEACETLAQDLGSDELVNQVLDAINDGILTAAEAKSALNAVQDPTWWVYE